MKTKLLVPTDFSPCAHNALDYALGLAQEFDSEIVLMHSILYNDSSFIDSRNKEEENTRRYNEAKANIDKELKFCHNRNQKIKIKTILDSGPTELSVFSILQAENIHYVVMGTEGSSGLGATIFGSFTSHVLEISPCPVFTIPTTGRFKGIKNILCATEMNETENEALKQALALAKRFEAQITFYNANANEDEQRVNSYKFQRLINRLSDYPSIDYVTVESNGILESIENFVCENRPDLIITLGKERNFLDQLFGKKITKKLCLHTTVPLLSFPTFHHTQEKGTIDLVKKR